MATLHVRVTKDVEEQARKGSDEQKYVKNLMHMNTATSSSGIASKQVPGQNHIPSMRLPQAKHMLPPCALNRPTQPSNTAVLP